jgi:small subunit ribosomal protein S2
MRDLLEAGVHFGHQTRRWNPKMRRFIFAERGGIYIIDLTQTAERLDEAQQFLRNVAERGGTVLFVGTKKQAQDAVEGEAKRIGMPYVNHRWLGGLLTNWRTMADRIDRLHEMRRLQEEGQLELLPAKERIAMAGELEKLEQNLGGVADMRRQPDAVVIVDLKKEALAVREARRLGVPVVALVDTNCDPDEADYVIPGNDDAIRSCNLVVHALAEAVNDGKQKVSARELEQRQEAEAAAAEAPAASVAEGDVEQVEPGAAVEPATEGESVPVPTGEDPAKEGAEVTKASEAALGDPTKAGSVAGEAADARPEDPAASGGRGGKEEA